MLPRKETPVHQFTIAPAQARTRTHAHTTVSVTRLDGAYIIATANWALVFVGVGHKVLELAALRLSALEAGDAGLERMGQRHAVLRAGVTRLVRHECGLASGA
jgi:hypothetical protein